MKINVVKPQDMPTPNDKPALWDLVIEDMRQRDEFGTQKYNTRLQPNNGRSFLVDAYQELLDLAVYVRGELYERQELAKSIDSLNLPEDVAKALNDISLQIRAAYEDRIEELESAIRRHRDADSGAYDIDEELYSVLPEAREPK